jgi:hypothetical protein
MRRQTEPIMVAIIQGQGQRSTVTDVIQDVSVNQVIVKHCCFCFGNTEADATIAILLPILKCFSCNGAVDWSTTCFCYESILQKR